MNNLVDKKYPSSNMKSLKRTMAIFGLAAVMTACASSGPEYVPISEGGDNGYVSQRLDDDTYRVTFSGSPGTPINKVQDYALLRAAEITIDSGYDKFTIKDETVTPMNPTSETASLAVEPTVHTTCGLIGCTSSPYTPGYSVLDANYPVQRQQFVSSLVVFLVQETQSQDDAVYYNAREVMKSIKNTLSL